MLCGHTTFCVAIHQLVDIWVGPLAARKKAVMNARVSFCAAGFVVVVVTFGHVSLRGSGSSVLNFWKNWHTFFQGGCTILYPLLPAVWEGSKVFTFSLYMLLSFGYSRPVAMKHFHYGFNLHFPDD